MASLSFLAVLLVCAFAWADCPAPADYVPGVDARGWAVAPADMPSEHTFLGDEATLNLDVSASDYSNNPHLQGHFPYAQIEIGKAAIDLQTGGATLNGKALGADLGDCK